MFALDGLQSGFFCVCCMGEVTENYTTTRPNITFVNKVTNTVYLYITDYRPT